MITTISTYAALNRSHLFSFIFSLFWCVIFVSCAKNETPAPQPPTHSLEIQTGAFTNLASDKVTLYGKLVTLNEDEILDYGFLIQRRSSDGAITSEESLSLGKNIAQGEIHAEYKPDRKFEQSGTYYYCLYVQTKNTFYKGDFNVFILNNISFTGVDRKYSYDKDTITLSGNFEGLDENYRIKASGAYSLTEIPYTVSADKKSLTFIVGPNTQTQANGVADISLVKRGENPLKYQLLLAQIEYLPRLRPPSKKPFRLFDFIDFSIENLAPLYDNDPRLSILINGIKIPYQRFLELSTFPQLQGSSFRIGYMNSKDSVYFQEPMTITVPTSLEINLNRSTIHPQGTFEFTSRDLVSFFSDSFSMSMGKHEISSSYDQWSNSVTMSIGDIPEGEYQLKIYNRFYSVIDPQKITIRKLIWEQLDKEEAYFGEQLTAIGNFIPGIEYYVFDENNRQITSSFAENGALKFTVNPEFEQVKTIRIGYGKGFSDYIIAETSAPFFSKGFTFERFYPNRGTTGDILIIEGKGISLATQFLLGTHTLEARPMGHDKVAFSIPQINGSGKMRISYTMNGKIHQTEELFELY